MSANGTQVLQHPRPSPGTRSGTSVQPVAGDECVGLSGLSTLTPAAAVCLHPSSVCPDACNCTEPGTGRGVP